MSVGGCCVAATRSIASSWERSARQRRPLLQRLHAVTQSSMSRCGGCFAARGWVHHEIVGGATTKLARGGVARRRRQVRAKRERDSYRSGERVWVKTKNRATARFAEESRIGERRRMKRRGVAPA